MIVEWLYSVWTNLSTSTIGGLPGWAIGQEYMAGTAGLFGPVASTAYNLGGWIPWSVGAFWLATTMQFYFASLVIRAIKSLIPTISG